MDLTVPFINETDQSQQLSIWIITSDDIGNMKEKEKPRPKHLTDERVTQVPTK
jgi:1,2-phenylacetyl-CoA epoxidase PaaB subunit